jgi:hypothetical protein
MATFSSKLSVVYSSSKKVNIEIQQILSSMKVYVSIHNTNFLVSYFSFSGTKVGLVDANRRVQAWAVVHIVQRFMADHCNKAIL